MSQLRSRRRADEPADMEKWRRAGQAVATFVVLLVLWEALVVLLKPAAYLVPPPSLVLTKFWGQWRLVLEHAWVTSQIILVGYGIAVAVTVPLALLISFSRFFETTVYPVIVMLQTVPKIAIAPIFIIWFGFGVTPKLLLVFLLCFFPILVASIAGFASINRDVMDLARSTGAGLWIVFRKIRLPAAAPHIFVGLRVAAAIATTAAVVAEFVASEKGLGYLLLRFNGDLETALSFATILTLSAIGLALYYTVEAVERIVLPWHKLVQATAAESGPT